MAERSVKFQNNRHKTVGGVAHTRYLVSISLIEKCLSSTCEKSDKNNLRVIYKQYSHLKTMNSTPVKFQRNRHTTVGGVAYTRYLLSIYFV